MTTLAEVRKTRVEFRDGRKRRCVERGTKSRRGERGPIRLAALAQGRRFDSAEVTGMSWMAGIVSTGERKVHLPSHPSPLARTRMGHPQCGSS